MLTLTPEAWFCKQEAEFLDVPEYSIHVAQKLKDEHGILSIPNPIHSKTLPQHIKTTVINFFEDDEFSRLMPGKKNYVSIARNIYKQRRLLLCNLKELYSAFKMLFFN